MNTPMLDKMLKVKEQSQICGEFLEWLQSRYAMFRLSEAREEPYYIGVGDYINIEKELAEFFGIDLEKAEKEKELLLEIERNKKKPHHCILCGEYIERDNLQVCDKCASKYKV